MTAKEAYKILKKEYPDLAAYECFEFPELYAFALWERGWNGEPIAGGYHTVNKTTGEIGGMTSVAVAFASPEPIEIPLEALEDTPHLTEMENRALPI